MEFIRHRHSDPIWSVDDDTYTHGGAMYRWVSQRHIYVVCSGPQTVAGVSTVTASFETWARFHRHIRVRSYQSRRLLCVVQWVREQITDSLFGTFGRPCILESKTCIAFLVLWYDGDASQGCQFQSVAAPKHLNVPCCLSLCRVPA